MRSLYWLTAVTLVAAAVTTVAIADYGRRHPQTVASWWGDSSHTTTVPVCCEKSAECSSTCVAGPTASPVMMNDIPELPGDDKAVPQLPPLKPIRVEDVPEHKQLREEALRNLASMQPEVPSLPPQTKNTIPVYDEFTFNSKPLVPLHVPLQPNAPVVMPPAKMMQEVAKLPTIPGVSLSQPINATSTSGVPANFNTLPDYRVQGSKGSEVMPGLHALKPSTPVEENPVYETMMTIGELISAMNPTTYLMAMPLQKKPEATPTAFATPEVKDDVIVSLPVPCDDKPTCCPAHPTVVADKSCCRSDGTCCKETASADEVVVRTYSVAEFTTTAGTNHDERIRLVTTMVAPDGWTTKDATIEYFALGKCLVVRHRHSVQDQVEDLLTQLRSQVLKQTTTRTVAPKPMIRMEFTTVQPTELELVPVPPCEKSERVPRVITNENERCLGDDEFFGMIPMRLDGRLMPVPATLPNLGASALVPAQFQPKANDPIFVEEGPVMNNVKSRTPEFFPWFLPYAPLPNGPESCEEELLNRVGFVSYTDEEIGYLFLLACEWEEGVR